MLTLKQLIEERDKQETTTEQTMRDLQYSDTHDWFQILVLAQLLFTLSDKKGIATSQGDTDYLLHANNCFSSSS